MAVFRPWDQQEGESDRAYSFFLMYADLPLYRRSLSELHKLAGNSSSKQVSGHWSRWKKKHSWASRASSRDLHLLKEERAELLALQKARYLSRRDEVDSMLEDCRRVLLSNGGLAEMFEKSPSSFVALCKLLVQIRDKTECELVGLSTLSAVECPVVPLNEELDEVLRVVSRLRRQSESGSVPASKILLSLNRISCP